MWITQKMQRNGRFSFETHLSWHFTISETFKWNNFLVFFWKYLTKGWIRAQCWKKSDTFWNTVITSYSLKFRKIRSSPRVLINTINVQNLMKYLIILPNFSSSLKNRKFPLKDHIRLFETFHSCWKTHRSKYQISFNIWKRILLLHIAKPMKAFKKNDST